MDEKVIEVLRVEITRLDIQPGEILLVRVPEAALKNASTYIEAILPHGVRFLVAPYEAEFSVIAASD